MIVRKTVELNGGTFTRTYSDAGVMIRKSGTEEIYSEAYDVQEFAYEETDALIEQPPALNEYEDYYNAMQEVIAGD